MASQRRVAIVAPGNVYVGPSLARVLAARGHDLVLGNAPADLVTELQSSGCAVVSVDHTEDLAVEGATERLVDAALQHFGRLDAAAMFSGQIATGRFLKSTVDDLHLVTRGCIEAPYRFMKAVIPPMISAGGGQVLVITSASAARATPGAPLYSAARAGANHLVCNVADEVARHRVQVNAVGTNFMDFPAFLKANRIDSPEARARVESMVPMGRLGTMDEFAHFCAVFCDGTSNFTTGQFVAYAGGWA